MACAETASTQLPSDARRLTKTGAFGREVLEGLVGAKMAEKGKPRGKRVQSRGTQNMVGVVSVPPLNPTQIDTSLPTLAIAHLHMNTSDAAHPPR